MLTSEACPHLTVASVILGFSSANVAGDARRRMLSFENTTWLALFTVCSLSKKAVNYSGSVFISGCKSITINQYRKVACIS
jgi:hypothetical protein